MPELTAEQLEARRSGIGSSDIASLILDANGRRVSPYAGAGPMAVYLDKVGIATPREETLEMAIGKLQEEHVIGPMYERVTGYETLPCGHRVHRMHPWAMATLDRKIVGQSRGAEYKAVGTFMMGGWDTTIDDGVPHHVRCQVVWQAEVAELEIIDVAALLGGTQFRIFPVKHDPTLAAMMIKIAGAFMSDHVLPRIAPDFDGSDAVREYLNATYPVQADPLLLDADTAMNEIAAARVQHAAAEKSALLAKKEADQRIMNAIGDHAGIKGDTWKATWKGSRSEPGKRTYRFTPGKGGAVED